MWSFGQVSVGEPSKQLSAPLEGPGRVHSLTGAPGARSEELSHLLEFRKLGSYELFLSFQAEFFTLWGSPAVRPAASRGASVVITSPHPPSSASYSTHAHTHTHACAHSHSCTLNG